MRIHPAASIRMPGGHPGVVSCGSTVPWLCFHSGRTAVLEAGSAKSAKLAEWLPYWLANVIKPNRKRSTYSKYAMHVRLYFVPLLGTKRLETLGPRDVRVFLADVARKSSAATAKEAHRVLRTALTAATREGLVTRNVASLVEALKVVSRETTPWSPPAPAARSSRGIRLHDARHGCATLLTAAGVAPRVLMEILGHSQISMTMDVYTHVAQDTQREAISHMDRLLKRRIARE
ncbi:tyrosine-type recombinase/integrase [Streptomyces lydicus]|uniref:tyrosine-type recombinase/integrase n=1 Tax=Streptomyces lydicus TaxID=47763 RepID=UPI00367A9630